MQRRSLPGFQFAGELVGAVAQYAIDHSTPPDDVQRRLIAETSERLGDRATMQISSDEGVFLQLLTQLSGARRAVEVGTFTGYSALSIARGLPEDGTLLCCDVSEEWTAIAREAWKRAEVADRIELKIGPGVDTLRALPREEQFDFAFIDADKPGYPAYYDEILPRLRRGGLMLIDNVLQSGRVVDKSATDVNVAAIRELNDTIVNDARVIVVLLPIGDGVSVVQKL
jgi:caffeoyl-CoA O-methyltransferase